MGTTRPFCWGLMTAIDLPGIAPATPGALRHLHLLNAVLDETIEGRKTTVHSCSLQREPRQKQRKTVTTMSMSDGA